MNTVYRPFKSLQLFLLILITLVGFACLAVGESSRKAELTLLQQHQAAVKNLVLLNNKSGLVPLKDLEQKIASVNIDAAYAPQFDSLLNKYTQVASFLSPVLKTDSAYSSLSDDLKFFAIVLVQGSAQNLSEKATQTFIANLQKEKKVIIAAFGNPAMLESMDAINAPIIWAETESPVTANYAAQLIFGGIPATGLLARTYSSKYQKGDGYKTAPTRLKYSLPEEVGINSRDLHLPIDSILAEAIKEKAAPGAVVMVVKDGNVIFNKAYGSHTYDKTRPTRTDDIFDLASLTKVSATTVALMSLYEQKKIKLDDSIGRYIPSLSNSNKANFTIRDILMHQAGLPAGVGMPAKASDLSKTYSDEFSIKAGDSLFIRNEFFKEVIWPRILTSKVTAPGKYIYSDLTMYLLKEVVERQALEPMNEFVSETLYEPLGMKSAGFLPRQRFDKEQIVPTENDKYFRKALLQGYVHDGGAAKMGGVSGHAGLFSSANDLAILYQMLLNGGNYGGIQYFSPQTVQMFTSRQSKVSRRGLGFDGYDSTSVKGYPSKLASNKTYGHTGYTGTCVWVDPTQNLVYIFLSNRVHPQVSNKLISLNIRSRVQDAVYKAITKGAEPSTFIKAKS